MRKSILAGLVAAPLLIASLAAAPAIAHHSGAMFDRTKEVRLEGVIKEFRWTNPHAWIEITVPNKQGVAEVWAIEMTSPNNLVLEGWKRSSLKAGDKVVLFANPLRDGRPGGTITGVKLVDGSWLGRGEPRS